MSHIPLPPAETENGRTTQIPEVSIWLDSYDEMFSDFDPRPYSKRTVSDDFITQARKVSRDRSGKVTTLKLLLPQNLRDHNTESMIAARLHDYFAINYGQLLHEKKKSIRKGLTLVCSGVLLMVAASYLSYTRSEAYIVHLLVTLSEPAGWFLLWMGLDQLTFYQGRSKKELNFFSKMATVRIEFSSY